MQVSQDEAAKRMINTLNEIEELINSRDKGDLKMGQIKQKLIEIADSAYDAADSEELEIGLRLLAELERMDKVNKALNLEIRIY